MNKDIYNKLRSISCKTGINISFYKNRLLNKSFFKDNLLKSVYFHIIDKCNLNCAYCNNYSPLAINDWKIYPNEFEKIVKRLKDFFPNIPFLSIGGGEPLLHPYLVDLCNILREYYPNNNISILSNGILLQSYNKYFIDNISKLNINLVITEYPIQINYNKQSIMYNSDKIIYTRQTRYQMFNLGLSISKQKDNNNYYNCQYAGFKNYKKFSPRCIQLDKNGNLFFCGILANIHLLENYFNIKFEKIKGKYGDYINIFDINDIEDILYGINNKIPFCDYCNEYIEESIEWKISERKLSEWVSN